jgi:membrane associated rhomboid family serine protease
MVLPLYDDNSDLSTTPIVNYVLIALNILVFVFLQGLGTNELFTNAFSTVPLEIATGRDVVTQGHLIIHPLTGQRFLIPGLQPTPIPVYLTLITSMFMHGSIAHIAGNMLFLWIFGDNVEDRLGHLRYLLFYLITGVLASLAHVVATVVTATDPNTLLIPSLGASGAISGVLGGYILLFPHRRVTVLQFFIAAEVPAWVAIGMWFVFQLISGLGVLGQGAEQGGVAYAAHIGGFIAGLVLVKLFAIGRPPRPPFRVPSAYESEGPPW